MMPCCSYYICSLPIVIGEAPRLSQATEVFVHSATFTAFNGSIANLVIHCNVTGIPVPTVTWFRAGNQIDEMFVTGFTLAMNVTENVEVTRSGVPHHCRATNRIGLNNSLTFTVRSPTILVRYYSKLALCYCPRLVSASFLGDSCSSADKSVPNFA